MNRHAEKSARFAGQSRKLFVALTIGTMAWQAYPAYARPELPTYSVVNNNPGFLQVYTNNLENLPEANDLPVKCQGDWQDLIYYMKVQQYSPDLFLVQQVSGQTQLNELVKRLNDELEGVYDGIVAVANPKWQPSDCGEKKAFQSTAIVYRKGRFDRVRKETWKSDSKDNGPRCSDNDQSRTVGVKARLYDKIARKFITAASIHWGTKRVKGPACAMENVNETHAEVTAANYGGELRIFGGDANISDVDDNSSNRPWYRQVNGDLNGALNYRDAIYSRCAGDRSCLSGNWTHQSNAIPPEIPTRRRIDFLFAGKAGAMPAVTNAVTVDFDQADKADKDVTGDDRGDLDYSEHRAIGARIHY